MGDIFTLYETGLTRLLTRLGRNHPHYAGALTLEQRLLENLAQARAYGDTETRRADRARIVHGLDTLALQARAGDLEFVPFLKRVAATNLLIIASEVHQMFGRYYGTAHTDDGEVLYLDGLIGFAEEHHARW